jgi:hypothetical protein
MVFSVDASLHGFGISSSIWDREDVAAVGRIREKTRWKLGAEKARQHAIQAAGFAMNADGKLARDTEGHAIRVPREILDSEFAERWEVAPDFQEVPSHLLADNLWKNVMSDRWRYDEGILLLEARAIVKAAERIANSIPQSHCRSLILGDNMSVTLSFGRWRAREFKLLVQLRRVAALGLARGIKFYFRWHPSEFNNADEGSRRFDLNFDTSYSVVRDLRNQPPVKVNLLAQDECTQTCSDIKSIGPDSYPACFAPSPL